MFKSIKITKYIWKIHNNNGSPLILGKLMIWFHCTHTAPCNYWGSLKLNQFLFQSKCLNTALKKLEDNYNGHTNWQSNFFCHVTEMMQFAVKHTHIHTEYRVTVKGQQGRGQHPNGSPTQATRSCDPLARGPHQPGGQSRFTSELHTHHHPHDSTWLHTLLMIPGLCRSGSGPSY